MATKVAWIRLAVVELLKWCLSQLCICRINAPGNSHLRRAAQPPKPWNEKGSMSTKRDGELKGGEKNPGSGRAATRWRLNELQTRKGGNVMDWVPSEHRRSSMGSAEVLSAHQGLSMA